MFAGRSCRSCSLILGLLALPAAAQDPGSAASSSSSGQAEQDRQLSFHAGPFRIAPYIRLGQIALDTNVYYTPEDRKTDLTASGGPGLRVELPIGRVNLYGDGSVNYYWFARTKEERRFGGAAGGGLDWSANAFRLGLSRFFVRSYERPSIEVDRRILLNDWRSQATLDVDFSHRFRGETSFWISNRETAGETLFLGSDLSGNLTEDRYTADLRLKLGLTGKTDFVLLGDQEWSRFPRQRSRNVDSNRLGGGFALESQTRLSGSVIGGVRLFRPRVPEAAGRSFKRPFVDADIGISGQKTRLAASFSLDTSYSAFSSTQTSLPTVDTQQARVFLSRRFGRLIEIDLSGGLTTLKNKAPVVVRRQGQEDVVIRDDQFYSASFDLGFRIRERLRLGLVATYNERQSNFADFGIDGLLLGASLRFNPPGLGSSPAGSRGAGSAGSSRRTRSP